MTAATLNAALYLRKSRDPNNLASIEDQERLGRAAIEAEHWTLAGVLDDAGRSASRFATRGRPGWVELLAMIGAGMVGVIVLWESSRGDRKLTEWSAFLDQCREQGVLIHVVSHHRTYDLRIPRDWRTLAEDGVDNAYESERISIRVKRGHAGAALRGEPYGPIPYGYRAVYSPSTGKREGWEIIPEAAKVVRHIFAWIAADKPVLTLVHDLTEKNIPSPGGRGWEQSALRKMVRSPTYAGLRKLPDGSLIDGKWPAIVTRQQWADACAVLDTRRPMARPGKQVHLLSYLARCTECDSGIVAYTRRGKLYYRCRKGCFSVHYDWLNDVVSAVIIARLSAPDAREIFRRDDSRSTAIANDLATLRARRSSFREMAALGKIEPDALAEMEASLNPQIERKQRELDALNVPPAVAAILAEDDVAAAWLRRGVQAKRAIIAALTGVRVSRPRREGRSMVMPDDWSEIVAFTGEPVVRRR